MTNDTRTTDDIERDIVDERAQMSDTFNDLQKKFSVDTILNDLGDMFRDQGGEVGRTISRTVGRNPAAVAVVGVGLAWLLLGKDRAQDPTGTDRQSSRNRTYGRNGRRASPTRWDNRSWTEGGHASDSDPSWYADGNALQNSKTRREDAGRDTRSSDDQNGSGGVMGRVKDAAGTMGHAISDTADSWSTSASDLTTRLSEGLDDLSEEAKSRVVSARRAAHEARLSSEEMMHNGVRRASNFFEDQPLVVGTLAVALGASIGAILPHSKFEDDAMGESRDRLFAEAQAVYREERDKAMATASKVGKTVASEVEGDIKDMGSSLGDLLPEGKSVGDVVVDHASDAAGRMVDRATGKPTQGNVTRSNT